MRLTPIFRKTLNPHLLGSRERIFHPSVYLSAAAGTESVERSLVLRRRYSSGPPFPSLLYQQRRAASMSTAEQTNGDGIAPVEEADAGEAAACPRKSGAAEPEALESESEQALPPLSAHEFKQYNRLAEHMDYFVSLLIPRPSSLFTPLPPPLREVAGG